MINLLGEWPQDPPPPPPPPRIVRDPKLGPVGWGVLIGVAVGLAAIAIDVISR